MATSVQQVDGGLLCAGPSCPGRQLGRTTGRNMAMKPNLRFGFGKTASRAAIAVLPQQGLHARNATVQSRIAATCAGSWREGPVLTAAAAIVTSAAARQLLPILQLQVGGGELPAVPAVSETYLGDHARCPSSCRAQPGCRRPPLPRSRWRCWPAPAPAGPARLWATMGLSRPLSGSCRPRRTHALRRPDAHGSPCAAGRRPCRRSDPHGFIRAAACVQARRRATGNGGPAPPRHAGLQGPGSASRWWRVSPAPGPAGPCWPDRRPGC